MSSHIDVLIKKIKPQFVKYKKYIQQNDWSVKETRYNEEEEIERLSAEDLKKEDILKQLKENVSNRQSKLKRKQEEFKVQNSLVEAITNRLKYFVKKTDGDHHLKKVKNFIKYSLGVIEIHSNRVDSYINHFDIADVGHIDLKSQEIEFHKDLFNNISKIEDKVSELDIKDEEAAVEGIVFYNNTKAPLSMHKVLSEIYPEINEKLKLMKIDFDREPDNKLHLYNTNPPQWNVDKHYWDQEPKILQYYVDEFKKLEDGINIDGYYMSGWMYYHINVFVTPIPQKVFNNKNKQYESKDKIMNPPLRDSEVCVFESHEEQKAKNTLFLFLAATRRLAKSTLEASKLSHGATIGKKELLAAGGSQKDLNQLAKNFKTDLQYKNPAFSVLNISNDWKDKVEMGIKTKTAKTILLSTLYIVNTDGGNASEILAGFTPDEFVFDEVMKGKFIEALEGLKPALKGTEGMIRCYGILSATGGDEALSKDGLTVLRNPDASDVLNMNWSMLERGVPEDCMTWTEDRTKPFGTFFPGQMCVDMPKKDSSLGEYIGREDSEALNSIKMKVTMWREATEQIEKQREKKKGNKVAYMKEVVYIPIKPSEIFMSGKQNPFPVEEAKAHKEYLLLTGQWDRRRTLYRDSVGKVHAIISTKDLAEWPHKGGIIDAPTLIFEDLPEIKPRFGTYAAGFDEAKQENSDTDSVWTFTVMKNKILGDPFSEKIVASIAFRPDKKDKVFDQWLMLMEAYNLEGTCFGENEDFAIKDYLDRLHLAEKYLAESLDFSQAFNIPNNLKRRFGWTPATTKKHLHGLFVDYCNESFEGEDQEGKQIIIKGVQRIDDIGLLDEIIGWSENANVDRMTSAYGAYGKIHHLQSSRLWKVKDYRQEEKQEEKPQRERPKSMYTSSSKRAGFYRKKR